MTQPRVSITICHEDDLQSTTYHISLQIFYDLQSSNGPSLSNLPIISPPHSLLMSYSSIGDDRR